MISVSRFATASVTRRPNRIGYKALLLASALLVVGACEEDTPADPVVIGSIVVSPRLSTARVGTTQQLEAAAFGPSGAPMSGETFTWSSSEKTVATVTESGLVTFVGSGSTAILATARGISGFATIVSDANVATVSIETADPVIQLGQTLQLRARAFDAFGVTQYRPITWSTSSATVATVTNGLVTGVSTGTATITATSEGKSSSLVFNVLPPAPVATIALSPAEGVARIGTPFTIASDLRDANNEVLNRAISWSSSNPLVATVSQSGVVTGLIDYGVVTITAVSEGKTATATIGVSQFTGLVAGVGRSLTTPTAGVSTFWAVLVPSGATSLNVRLLGGTGDPDLYLYPPEANNPVCASETFGALVDENCVRANPVAGVWIIEVYAYEPHANNILTATVIK